MSPFLDAQALTAHKKQNTLHTAMLFFGLAAIICAGAYLLFGFMGVAWAAVVIGLLLLIMPSIPPEMLMRMYRARRVEQCPGDQLSDIVDVLAQRAGLIQRPALYVVPSMALNAFAAGSPERAAVAITEGLLRRLTLRETAGVLAHEMSHIRNNDLWVLGVADMFTRLTQGMSYVAIVLAILNITAAVQGEQYASWWAIVFLYLGPMFSNLMQLGLSRTREYDADLEGAQLTGDPLGLAAALRRLDDDTGRMWEDVMLPAPGRRVAYPSVLRSHPMSEDRVRRLVELSGRPMLPPLVFADRPLISLVGFGPVEMRPRVRFPGVWF